MTDPHSMSTAVETRSLRAQARHGEANPLVAGVPRHVHLLGAGGAGLSGAALVLHSRGHVLTGYDKSDSRFVRSLRVLGVPIALGESQRELLPPDTELVARSAAVANDDPQVLEAQRRGVRVIKYAELLGLIAPARRTLAVAGTHGKTTTSWLTYYALRGLCEAAGRGAPTPGALIGGACRGLSSNAVPPQLGGWFAAEACEYDRSFLQIAPEGAIVTNVEPDHLDYYKTYDAIEEAFARFVDRVHPDGLLVVGRDVPERVVSASPCTVWRLGREIHVDLLGEQHGFFRFRLRGPGFATPEVALEIPGAFNVENAALALALSIGVVGRQWHLDLEQAADAAARSIHRYKGAERRFEPWGTHAGVEVVHDYAHHPTEVRATLEAARRALPGKPLHVLFQPHQHSRTARFIDDFVESLRAADRVVVSEVYGARAHIDRVGAGAEDLVVRLKRAGIDATFGGAPSASVAVFAARVPAGSAALVFGAGDIDLYKDELVQALLARSSTPRSSQR